MISGPGSHGGVFNHSNICWKGSMVVCKQSKSFLESTEESLLTQVIYEINYKGNLLSLLLTSKEKLVGDMNINFGCSDHVMTRIQDPERINESK